METYCRIFRANVYPVVHVLVNRIQDLFMKMVHTLEDQLLRLMYLKPAEFGYASCGLPFAPPARCLGLGNSLRQPRMQRKLKGLLARHTLLFVREVLITNSLFTAF